MRAFFARNLEQAGTATVSQQAPHTHTHTRVSRVMAHNFFKNMDTINYMYHYIIYMPISFTDINNSIFCCMAPDNAEQGCKRQFLVLEVLRMSVDNLPTMGA